MEWEEFQRDCHPFPAYVDYIYGRDIKQAISEPVRSQPPSSRHSQPQKQQGPSHAVLSQGQSLPIASASSFAPRAPPLISAAAVGNQLRKPIQISSSGQFMRDFQTAEGLPAAAAFAPVVRPPNQPLQSHAQVLSNPMPQNPTAMRIIRHGELLQPQYAWMVDQLRYQFNEKINEMWTVVQDKSRPLNERIKARDILIKASNQISLKHTHELKTETTKRNIHKELPKLWQALKARSSLPASHGVHQAAGQYLISMMGTLDADARKYAKGLIVRMIEAEGQGRNALEVVPGFVVPKVLALKKAATLRSDTPVDMGQREGVYPRSNVYASTIPPWASSSSSPQMQSSPLPEWKGF